MRHQRFFLSIIAIVLTVNVMVAGNKHGNKSHKYNYPQLLSKQQLLANRNLLGGVYRAYPLSSTMESPKYTPAPKGYTPYYISHYGRHGSRYQPNDSRYANSRQRLQEAHDKGALTPLGEDLLKRVNILCDSCLGHGGLLTSVGARQHEFIARRMYHNFPEVFSQDGNISARASIVTRCGQSMQAFLKGLSEEASAEKGKSLNINSEIDSAYMAYIAYDTPAMKELSSKTSKWYEKYNKFMAKHVDKTPFIQRLFTDASGVDTLQTTIDLYWLAVGMQNLNMKFNLDDVFTPEELFACWQCVNYRMYVCNANSPISNNIPAQSASSLLRNIIETADTTHQIATLRFGHDSNLLRLLALMKVHNAAYRTSKLKQSWTVWQECQLSPMAANLQLIFYRNSKNNILVKILLNEREVTLDSTDILPVQKCYYRWKDLRKFWLSQM